jgi:hypothetical protein
MQGVATITPLGQDSAAPFIIVCLESVCESDWVWNPKPAAQ